METSAKYSQSKLIELFIAYPEMTCALLRNEGFKLDAAKAIRLVYVMGNDKYIREVMLAIYGLNSLKYFRAMVLINDDAILDTMAKVISSKGYGPLRGMAEYGLKTGQLKLLEKAKKAAGSLGPFFGILGKYATGHRILKSIIFRPNSGNSPDVIEASIICLLSHITVLDRKEFIIDAFRVHGPKIDCFYIASQLKIDFAEMASAIDMEKELKALNI